MLGNHRTRTIDRLPDITPAGKLFGNGDRAVHCLNLPARPQTPEQVHKFRCTTQSAPGKQRIFYGRYSDGVIADTLRHGASTKPSLIAGQLISPQPKSHFKYLLERKREDGVYASHKRSPLGTTHDPAPMLPTGVGPYDQTYGIPTLRDISAGELVSPSKTATQVNEESVLGKELYIKSHLQYDVGEAPDRKYDWTRISPKSSFGVETPHDNLGGNARRTLHWCAGAKLTSKRCNDFREKCLPQIGKVHDPLKDTLKVQPGHVFGTRVEQDEFGAGDLIHLRTGDVIPANEFDTSYSTLNGILRKEETRGQMMCGIPTMRTDLAPPTIRRVGDNASYGDESDAHGLMNPSIYATRGVYEEDFFKSRDQLEIKRIFDSAGVEMSHEMFLELWDAAAGGSHDGQVSVETFRNLLSKKLVEEFEGGSKKVEREVEERTNPPPWKAILAC